MKTLAICLFVIAYAKVLQITEVCRHGARAPTQLYPWDVTAGLWPYGAGELIPVGMRQHFLLGSELRQRYVVTQKLLHSSYTVADVYFRSTDVNRTIMSAQSQIMGLFPASTGPTVSNELEFKAVPPIKVQNINNIISTLNNKALPNQFQAFPVHVFPQADDFVLQANSACGLLVQNIKQLYNSTAYANNATSNVLVWKTLQQVTGFNNATLLTVYNNILDDILISNWAGNLQQLPAPFQSQEFLAGAAEAFNRMFSLPYQTDVNARLFSSAFFLDLLQEIGNVTDAKPYTPFRLFSAHDTTVAGLLAGLKNFNNTQPPFASSLIFETSRSDEGLLYMRVIYNDVPLLMPACPNDVYCPIETFIEYLQFRAYDDVSTVCSSTSSSSDFGNLTDAESGKTIIPHKGSSGMKWVAWVAIALAAVVLVLGLAACIMSMARKEAERPLLPMSDMNVSGSSVGQKKVINQSKLLG